MENKLKLSISREKYPAAPRPNKLRFFWELSKTAQDTAVAEECEQTERFDWDDAGVLTEDFKMQLAERGFPDVNVFWSLGYCQGDGVAFYRERLSDGFKGKRPKCEKVYRST